MDKPTQEYLTLKAIVEPASQTVLRVNQEPQSPILPLTVSTTGRQSLINRRAGEHSRGGGSNPRGRHSGFVRAMARSTTSFASGDISCQLAIIVHCALPLLRRGVR